MVFTDELCKYGEFINGSAVCFRQEENFYRKGLLFEDGTTFFPEGSFDDFHDGLALMQNSPSAAYVNRNGDILKFEKFSFGTRFSNERAFIGNEEQIALIDTNGKIIKRFLKPFIPAPFHNGLARVFKYTGDETQRMEAVINTDGKFIIPFFNKQPAAQPVGIDENDFYSDELFRIRINNKYAFIDKNVNMKIPYIYDWASAFHCGVAAVRIDEKYGFINKKNNYVLPSFFEDAKGVRECMAPVKLGGKWGMITMAGKFLLDCDFEDVGLAENGQIPFKKDGKWGLMHKNGTMLAEPNYDNLFYFKEGLAQVSEHGKLRILLSKESFIDNRESLKTA